jgi:Protein of unknown function (DUF2909)
MKTLIIGLAFLAIIGALAAAGVFMLRDGRDGKDKSGAMMRALALRVGLSVLLFACIMFSYWAGWIHPTGIPIGQ